VPRHPAALLLGVLALSGCATARRPVTTVPVTSLPIPVVQIGDPVLRSPATEVPPEMIATADFQALVQRMIATMRAAPGVGLAAPQIGVPWRVIVLEDRAEYVSRLTEQERLERVRAPFEVRVLVNPVLRAVGGERATFFEGCLSVPGFVALVDRASEVEVHALDEGGVARTWRVKGWPARILQHEVDHLDGTLYVDRMKTRSFSTAEQAKARFGGKPIAEIQRDLGL
jgi:peptide deformylase